MDRALPVKRTLAVLLILISMVMISIHILPAVGFVGTVFYPILIWPCVLIIVLAAWVLWRSANVVAPLDGEETNRL